MDKKLNVMKIKLSLDVSEATEKLNRCEDQIDRILEKQKQISNIVSDKAATGTLVIMKDGYQVYVDDRNIEQLAKELNFHMKQQNTKGNDIKELVRKLEPYRNKQRQSNIER